MRIGFAAAALSIGLAWAPASATIIYEQPAGGAGTWTSHINPDGSGFQTYDNFQLGSAATITHVRWRGGMITLTPQTPAPLDLTGFRLQFYADVAGLPDTIPLASTTVALASVQRASQGIETATSSQIPLEIFEFTTGITPFAAQANTTYWFTVVATANQFDPFFAWRPGTGGDDLAVQLFLSPGGTVTGSAPRSDRAFALADSAIAVPEPSTPALLIAALLGLATMRRLVPGKTAR